MNALESAMRQAKYAAQAACQCGLCGKSVSIALNNYRFSTQGAYEDYLKSGLCEECQVELYGSTPPSL